jgi:L-fucose mutarotase/ribose pyranase (RbsD/FucU family)
MSDIKTILKEATQDLLSDEVLKEIENAFNTSVNEKVQVHVTKALTEQDEDYSKKLETLLEAIDADHTLKLQKVVEAIDTNHADKLKNIVEKYSKVIKEEAAKFKNETINNISTYLEAYIDETIPSEEIKDAVKNKRAFEILGQIRNILGVDAALAKESVREAVIDGKNQINEASKKLEAVTKELATAKAQLAARDAELTFEKKTASLSPRKRDYVNKVMNGKSAQFITENIDYALSLFDKTEKERLQNIKEEAVTEATSTQVDRPVVEESVQVDEKAQMNPYLAELSKY